MASFDCYLGNILGKLVVSPIEVYFRSSLISPSTFPIASIQLIQKERSPYYIYDNAIRIKINSGTEFLFTGCSERNEVVTLIEYLRENPPKQILKQIQSQIKQQESQQDPHLSPQKVHPNKNLLDAVSIINEAQKAGEEVIKQVLDQEGFTSCAFFF